MAAMNSAVLYQEEQQFRQGWVWLLLAGIAAVAWWGFYEQILRGRPWGNNPAPDWLMWLMALLFGIGFPLWFWRMKLVVEVTPDDLRIRLRPFTNRAIPLVDIVTAEPRTYRPIGEFGGWGVRGLSRRNMAYNVSGDQGVQLTLRDGDRVLIGSQQAQTLALAIRNARGA
jgi:hypothetical protein